MLVYLALGVLYTLYAARDIEVQVTDQVPASSQRRVYAAVLVIAVLLWPLCAGYDASLRFWPEDE